LDQGLAPPCHGAAPKWHSRMEIPTHQAGKIQRASVVNISSSLIGLAMWSLWQW